MQNFQPFYPSAKLAQQPKLASEYGECVVSGTMAVCAALSTLVETRQVLSVWQKKANSYFFVTLMAFDPSKGLIYLERGPEGDRRAGNLAEDFLCYAEIDQEQVQFTLNGLLQDSFYGTPVWIANLPDRLIRIQQREFPRIPIPVTRPSFCKITGINGLFCPKEIRLQLVDLSTGGIGFVAPLIMCGVFRPNATYSRCELQLYNELPVQVNLKVRTAHSITSKSGIKAVRIGAEITSISRANTGVIAQVASQIEQNQERAFNGAWETQTKVSRGLVPPSSRPGLRPAHA
ncbi:MAG: Flagellar brake protein [Pseudomonadota bacterium]|jgi:c-di-GMP-binding flagellar brake protein YcgR